MSSGRYGIRGRCDSFSVRCGDGRGDDILEEVQSAANPEDAYIDGCYLDSLRCDLDGSGNAWTAPRRVTVVHGCTLLAAGGDMDMAGIPAAKAFGC